MNIEYFIKVQRRTTSTKYKTEYLLRTTNVIHDDDDDDTEKNKQSKEEICFDAVSFERETDLMGIVYRPHVSLQIYI